MQVVVADFKLLGRLQEPVLGDVKGRCILDIEHAHRIVLIGLLEVELYQFIRV